MRQNLNHITNQNLKNHSNFAGYASVFNVQDSQKDIILKGAFKKSLANNIEFDLLWEHNPKMIIGNVRAKEDNRGLYIKGKINLLLNGAVQAQQLLQNMSLNHMSIGYQVADYYVKNGIRYIKELLLHEVSIVAHPSNASAKIYSLV